MRKQFTKKLLLVVLLVMMLSAHVNAQIIYTDIIPDTTINTNNGVYHLDLNNDGIIDFNINYYSSVVTGSCGVSTVNPTNLLISVTPLGTNEVGRSVLNFMPFPSALSLNHPIDSATFTWLNTGNQLMSNRNWICFGGGPMNPNPPNWLAQNNGHWTNWSAPVNKYLPLRLYVGSQKYYGWIRLNVAMLTASFTAQDYAYNTIPGQPILAGETSCIPPTVTLTPGSPISLCNGDSVQLNAVTNSVYMYQWFKDGNSIIGADTSFYTTNSSGAYYVTVGNSCGYANSAVDTVSVFVNDITVTTSGSILTSNAANATYQWMDCSSMQIIPGANSQSFSPSQGGTYAVIVTENGCSDTSSCYSVTPTGIYENMPATSVMLFPNPATNQVTIDVGGNNNQVAITISDMTGKIIYTTAPRDLQKVDVNTSNFAEGLYIVQIEAADFITTKKLVVKK
ncbi:MAG: T9SS type A sorting domain-containing protein [Bacteroidetes bacterium]|nr:T9SS type A sorting domain-containing protein [Bacteroidota bacterium]